jgi:rhodanese-related sulfurtransferase
MKSCLTAFLILFLSSFTLAQQTNTSATIAKDVDVKEFNRLMKEKPGLLLDVRTQGEVDKGAIKGHTHIDFFADNFEAQIDKLDKTKPVYVYCASGGRSGETMEMMHKKGFREVYNLDGGYNAWKKTMPDK